MYVYYIRNDNAAKGQVRGHCTSLHTSAVDEARVHCRVFEHIRTINSGGDYDMAYPEDPSQVYDPKWVFPQPRMHAALLIPPWISVTIHCPG